jgi:hypothetical protein
MSLVESAPLLSSETDLNIPEPVIEIEESHLSSALTIEQMDDPEKDGETPSSSTSNVMLESASSAVDNDTRKRMMRLVRNREAAKK